MALDGTYSGYNPNKYFDVFGRGQTPNPFYNISNQFIPRNFHDVIKWSRYILTQSPTVAEVIRKLATYPITDFNVDTSNPQVKQKYEEIFKSVNLKSILNDIGFDFFTLGNVFISIYFPINRFLECPECHAEYNAKNCQDHIQFKKFKFVGSCPRCQFRGEFRRHDRKSTNVEDINIIKWPAENISVNYNPITGEAEYYYKFNNDTRRRIMTGDSLFVSTVPWSMIEAVKNKQDFKFAPGNIFHLKGISMGDVLEGYGMPPVISLYSSIFHQTLLKRANEAIATEHMTPMRILYPNQSSQAGDPISMMSLNNFVSNMERNLKKFKHDPNHITVSPVPVGYENVGGQGRALLVSQELQLIEESILMGLGVSRELLSGTTNWTSSTVGLRLLENTLHDYVTQIEEVIEWFFTKLSQYLGITNAKVSLTPFKLTDDDTMKKALPDFMNSGLVSPSTMLKAYDIDYHEELKKTRKDTVAKAISDIETRHEVSQAKFMKSRDVDSEDQDDNGYKETRQKAYEYAQEILNMDDPEKQTQALFQLHQQDETMYQQVADLLTQYSEMRRSSIEEKQNVRYNESMDQPPEEQQASGQEGGKEEGGGEPKEPKKPSGPRKPAKPSKPSGDK